MLRRSVAIKSGTNNIHGTAYDFLRNDALDARNFYAVRDPITGREKAQLRYNQFGASIGGPIVLPKLVNGRDKLFFFGDYQGEREHLLPGAAVAPERGGMGQTQIRARPDS